MTQHTTRLARSLRTALASAALVGTATLLLGACGSSTEPADTTEAPDSAGTPTSAPTGIGGGMQVANPASAYCVDQGGFVDIRDEAGGQVGYCLLPDGTEIEEWEFFNSQSATTTGG